MACRNFEDRRNLFSQSDYDDCLPKSHKYHGIVGSPYSLYRR
jgi:hypothetical protein